MMTQYLNTCCHKNGLYLLRKKKTEDGREYSLASFPLFERIESDQRNSTRKGVGGQNKTRVVKLRLTLADTAFALSAGYLL